jgi:Zn-dependent M16 (insulinase) family peptidase
MYSYRDPRLTKTLEVFRGLRAFVNDATWSQTDIDRSIIGSAKDYQRPIRPGEATSTALSHYVTGHTPEVLQADYEELLAATPERLKRVMLEQLEANEPRAAVCVVSSREKLEHANTENPAGALAIEDILKS